MKIGIIGTGNIGATLVRIVSTWQGPVASQDWLPLFRAAARFPWPMTEHP